MSLLSLSLSLSLSPSLLFCFLFSLHKLSRRSRKRSYHTRTQAREKETIRSQKRCLFCPAAIPSPRMRIKYRTKQVLRALFFLFFSTQTPASRFYSSVFLKKVCRYRHGAERNTHLLTHSFLVFSILNPLFDCRSFSFSLSLSLSLSRLNGALRAQSRSSRPCVHSTGNASSPPKHKHATLVHYIASCVWDS